MTSTRSASKDGSASPLCPRSRRLPTGQAVLLIDDTWTTGASAQGAAAALKAAGVRPVAAVVIGRHLNGEWHENDCRLRGIAQPFDRADCALCAEPVAAGRRSS